MRPRHKPSHVAFAVLICLLTVDVVFVLLHIVTLPEPREDATIPPVVSRLSLDADRGGYPERFGYAKLLFSAGACLILHRWTKQPTYLGWSFALLVAFTDDAFMLHERIGGELAHRLALAPSFGLRAQDLGELLAWAILGMLVLTALVWTHLRSAGEAQRDSRILASMVFALAFFGVVMDMVHVTVTGLAERIVGTIEGAGELAVPSLIVAYVVASILRVHNSAHARDSVRLRKGDDVSFSPSR